MSGPSPGPEPDGVTPPQAGRIRRLRNRGETAKGQAEGWLARRRQEAMPVDLAVQYYERDRDSFASVLGAAIALRLFLFFVPAMLVLLAFVMLFTGTITVWWSGMIVLCPVNLICSAKLV